jgi:hypothetical protein
LGIAFGARRSAPGGLPLDGKQVVDQQVHHEIFADQNVFIEHVAADCCTTDRSEPRTSYANAFSRTFQETRPERFEHGKRAADQRTRQIVQSVAIGVFCVHLR